MGYIYLSEKLLREELGNHFIKRVNDHLPNHLKNCLIFKIKLNFLIEKELNIFISDLGFKEDILKINSLKFNFKLGIFILSFFNKANLLMRNKL